MALPLVCAVISDILTVPILADQQEFIVIRSFITAGIFSFSYALAIWFGSIKVASDQYTGKKDNLDLR
jgi:hypothetical protein